MEGKLIVRINKDITIAGDKHQYIVRVNTEGDKFVWYLPDIGSAFQEIYDYLCRKRLITGGEKSIEEVAKIVSETKAEIHKIMKPFADIRN